MRYDVIPSTFAALITAIIIFVTGLSVLLKNPSRSLHRSYSLYTLTLTLYFLSLGSLQDLGSVPGRTIPSLVAVLAGGSASWFFQIFLFGKSGSRFTRLYLLFSALALLSITYLSLTTPSHYSTVVGTIVLVHILLSTLNITASIAKILRSTTSTFVRTRLKYLSISTLTFLAVLVTTQTHYLGEGAIYMGYIVTVVYISFLGQALLQQRFMDLHELLTRMGILVVIVLLISTIYFGLLFWIPKESNEFLILNIIVGSIIVLLLLEPLEKLSREWVRFLFWRRKNLGNLAEELGRELEVVQDSQSHIATLVTQTLGRSKEVGSCTLYLVDDDRITLLGTTSGEGTTTPLVLSAHRELMERLSYSPYVLKDEIEQELDRLKRGWALSLGAEALKAALDSLSLVGADLALSLRIQGSFVGFLAVTATPVGEAFSESDVLVFRAVAKHIGSALANTERFKEARERDRLAILGKMSAGLAHEIRNPLGAIKGAAQLLAEESAEAADGADQHTFLSIITEETDRLNTVVNTFLEFSRSRSDQRGDVFLAPLLEKIRDMVETMENRVTVHLDCEAGLSPVEGDADKLKQVLLNLTVNALQSMEEVTDPLLTLSLERTNQGQRITVQDRGVGMSEGTLQSIFDPFFTTKKKGTGLGLALSKKIIDEHGGELRVTSTPGKGSTFWITLPAAQQ